MYVKKSDDECRKATELALQYLALYMLKKKKYMNIENLRAYSGRRAFDRYWCSFEEYLQQHWDPTLDSHIGGTCLQSFSVDLF